MPYSKSLRAIGQSLETVHVEAFGLEKEGDSYVMRSQSLTPSRQFNPGVAARCPGIIESPYPLSQARLAES
jgi:hypothetical protein